MKTFLAAVLIVGVIGCSVAPEDPPQKQRPGPIEASHVCAGSCDHVMVEGGWKVIPNHKHGPGCGHVLVNGRWVNAAEAPAEPPPKDR